MMREYKLIYRA